MKQNQINLKGERMDEDYSHHNININRATDLRGNMPHTKTKHVRK